MISRGSRARSLLSQGCAIGAMVGVLTACGADARDAAGPLSASVAAIEVSAATTTLLAGETVRVLAVARDAGGRVLPNATFTFSSSDSAMAVVDAAGTVTARGHGAVSVLASSGSATASVALHLRLTTEERRFAYALAQEPAAGSAALSLSQVHNETGGKVSAVRVSRGAYVISFERLAKVESAFRETVLVTSYGRGGERCQLSGWDNAVNARDLNVSVSCYSASGLRSDARFSVLVVGSRSLPSRMGFTVAGDATTDFAAEARHTFSSFADDVAISRSTPGSYLVRMNGSHDDAPESYFVSTFGDASELCKVSAWNHGAWASVICYAPGGTLADSRFALLMVESGRPGKRFGFAWANAPATPIGGSYTPSLDHQRTSSGAPVRINHEATGVYRVSFPGLARAAGVAETVHVSPYGGGLYGCQVESWANGAAGDALDALVRCWNQSNGAPADTYFTILVVE
ncbi:MAG: Ig-like domain-containing protein [Gemmatimonadaceae bacterium]